MGTLLPKIRTDGTVFQEFEYVTPQDYVHFCFSHPAFEHLYSKVFLASANKMMPVQEVGRITNELQFDVDIMIEGLENVIVRIDENDLKVQSGLKNLHACLYPRYELKDKIPTRVFCVLPRDLPKLFEIAAKAGVAGDLALAVRDWKEYWYVPAAD